MSLDENTCTCVCCLIVLVIAGFYLVWSNYGSMPFVIGGVIIAGIGVLLIRNSRSVKQTQQQKESSKTIEVINRRISEEKYERQQRAKGLEKYVNKSGNTLWGTPEHVAEWARMDKASVEVIIKKEIVKIRCQYCGKLYNEPLDSCPNCGGSG